MDFPKEGVLERICGVGWWVGGLRMGIGGLGKILMLLGAALS